MSAEAPLPAIGRFGSRLLDTMEALGQFFELFSRLFRAALRRQRLMHRSTGSGKR